MFLNFNALNDKVLKQFNELLFRDEIETFIGFQMALKPLQTNRTSRTIKVKFPIFFIIIIRYAT